MAGNLKAIIPPKFDQKAVEETLRKEMEKYAPFLIRSYERTTGNWTGDKPKFTPVFKIKVGMLVLEIRVLGSELARNKWHWLDKGTRPHVIKPKNVKFLKFVPGYSAGSRPGQLFTIAGQPGTGPAVFAKEVHHPGTKARGFTGLIVKDNQTPFERWMRAAMGNAAERSGHSSK